MVIGRLVKEAVCFTDQPLVSTMAPVCSKRRANDIEEQEVAHPTGRVSPEASGSTAVQQAVETSGGSGLQVDDWKTIQISGCVSAPIDATLPPTGTYRDDPVNRPRCSSTPSRSPATLFRCSLSAVGEQDPINALCGH